jgi:hypothetical protein
MAWSRLHDFAFDCMRFASENFPLDTLTIIDFDQLAVGHGYSHYLAQFLNDRHNIGMLGNSPGRQQPNTRFHRPGSLTENVTSGDLFCGSFRRAKSSSYTGHFGPPPSSRQKRRAR